MDLFITTFGARIRRRHDQIVVEIPNEKALREYPARHLDRIIISGHSSISSDAILLALKHGVDISYLGAFGKTEARIVPSTPTGATKVRHAQFRVALSGDAFLFARQFVFGKMRNQIAVARLLDRDADAVTRMTDALAHAEQAGSIATLMSAEGRAAERYFSGAWSHVLGATGRDQQGGDCVNAALNYGYGVLYNEAERAVLNASLDQFIGMLHSERYGKPSLTLDMVEEFRVPIIDAVILPLFVKARFTKRDFIQANGHYTLSPYGKKKIIRGILMQLNVPVLWNGREQRLGDIVTGQSQALARCLVVGDASTYQPFVAPDSFYEKSLFSDRSVVEDPKPEAESGG